MIRTHSQSSLLLILMFQVGMLASVIYCSLKTTTFTTPITKQSFHDEVLGHSVLMRTTEKSTNELTLAFSSIRSKLSQLPSVQYLAIGEHIASQQPNSEYKSALFDVFDNDNDLVSYNADSDHIRIKEEIILPLLDTSMKSKYNGREALLAMDVHRCARTNQMTDANLCSHFASGKVVVHSVAMNMAESVSENDINRFCYSLCKLQGVQGVLEMYCSVNYVPYGQKPRNQGYQLGLIAVLSDEDSLSHYNTDSFHLSIKRTIEPMLNHSNPLPVVRIDYSGSAPCRKGVAIPGHLPPIHSSVATTLIFLFVGVLLLTVAIIAVFMEYKRKMKLKEQRRENYLESEQCITDQLVRV